ncbi:uncharacterized protein JN550_002770 [Neoarthrinium moseri]|uniref:uncharacterized protein n=1 Tax=Neoarthrinium moseri TaxID=1658444 RepID=UPI001FDE3EE7|nr:uncharacterized protein JN550_002770 [Neoarthrinium moseri]KAI1874191.1 hypothetical protein JN550_002770 [Neoarthrinium moseri]
MVRISIQATLLVACFTPFVQTTILPFDSVTSPHIRSPLLNSNFIRSEVVSDQATPLIKTATLSEIQKARKIVEDAISQASVLNKARLDNPIRTPHGGGSFKIKRDEVPELLKITPEIAAAAALIAEADTETVTNIEPVGNSTKRSIHARGSYWMESIARKGTVPWGRDSSYKVFRNVKDYGAKGDGRTDDTAAIMKAMTDGKRCGEKCNGSTTKNAIVYFPSGTYLVSSSIDVYFGTQVIGDAEDRPTIKAAASFVGLGVLSTDKYVGGVGTDGKDNEWYVNTASFYRQIRNLIIDITATDPNAYVCALHYQVAQATSIQHLDLVAKTGTTQQGIYAENGSGGHMSDIVFKGGNFGFYGGAQQFTAQRMMFQGCKTAVQLIWDWGWVWKQIAIEDSEVGFRLLGEGGAGNIGSITIMDSVFTGVTTGIIIAPYSKEPGMGSTGVALDNIRFTNGGAVVKDTAGATLLAAGDVESWILGPNYGAGYRLFDEGKNDAYERPKELLGGTWGSLPQNEYLEKPRPSYTGYSAGDFVHLKDYATGDGVTDDTAGVQRAFNDNAGGKIIFADAGTYILTDTVTIPPGVKIVGETWTQFAASGSKFSDMKNPRVMLKVGNEGDVGDVEIQDLMFTTKGATAGAILVEWNILAASPGSAGMWDSHARIGGATGTELTPAECPALTSGEIRPKCIAATMMMHITDGASGYFENMWLWVADHMVDDPDLNSDNNEMTQISVYVARGLLIESKDPVWLYGTASEHATFYQYSFYGAKNVVAGLIQTETPYYQPTPKAPTPFEDSVRMFLGDPYYECGTSYFDGCDSSWGLILNGCQDVYIPAAGIYSWFSTYSQSCIDVHECQKALVLLIDNEDWVRVQNLITIGAANSLVYDGVNGVNATNNLGVQTHPTWSQITVFDAPAIVPYDEDDDPTQYMCNDDKYYNSSLDTIQGGLGSFSENCIPIYTIPVLDTMLSQAMYDYDDVNQGYDSVFGYYVKYVEELVQPQIDAFMSWPTGPGLKYFDCEMKEGGDVKMSGQCPLDFRWRDEDFFTLTFTLKDKDGFFNELADKYGIQSDWVKFGTDRDVFTCTGTHNQDCSPWSRTKLNYPQKADDMKVTNPKDIITQAKPGIDDMHETMAVTFLEINGDTWEGEWTDVMEVLSTPVSMMAQAVESMKKAKEIAEREHEQEKNQLIINIISAVFMLIPFAGEALGAAASVLLQTLGRVLFIVGELGAAALTIKDIVDNPDMAPLAILGMLAGFGGKGIRRSPDDFAEMAKAKRLMNADDVSKAGDIFKKNNDKISNMVNTCIRN